MAFFNEFPRNRSYDDDLGWLIANMKKVIAKVDNYNEVSFADPIAWNITTQYPEATIVRDGIDGPLYISRKPVPVGITLNNGEYWETLGGFDQMFTGVIKNVQDYGAAGIAGADYTEQVQAAIDDGNIIYFPAGTYSFGTISINKDIVFFGDGESSVLVPLHRNTENNAYKPMVTISTGNRVVFDSLNFTGDNSITSETGIQEYTQAVIRAYNSNIEFKKCYINDMVNDYRLTVADVPFHEREGIFLYASNCDLLIDGCVFGTTFYGNELIWASRPRANYASGKTIIRNCTFNDRINGGSESDGSALDILGGTIEFYNNTGKDSFYLGSFANLMGDIVDIHDNTFTGFYGGGSMIDVSEGYYNKNTLVTISDNYFEFEDGARGIQAFTKNAKISNNVIKAECPIKFLQTNDYSALDTYHATENLETDLDELTIINNTLISTKNGTTYYNTGLVLGQSPQSAGSRATYNKYLISGNEFYNGESVTTPRQQIEILTNAILSVIGDNVFHKAGTAQSGTRLAFIGTNDSAAMKMVLNGNYFAPPASAANVIFTNSVSGPAITAVFAGNSTEDTTNLHAGPSTLSPTILSNNANILT